MSRRVLFSCFPGYGHLHPLLPLAEAYRDRGYEVLVATGPELVERVERHGFRAAATGLSMAETERRYYQWFPDSDLLPPVERLLTVLPNMFVDIAARNRALDLVPLATQWAPDVVVHDVSEFAAPVAAALTGAQLVTHGITLVNPSVELTAIVRPAMERLCDGWGLPDVDAVAYAGSYLDICPPGLQSGPENPHPDVRALRPVQPQPTAADRLPEAVRRLPYEQTVYVTLGTVVNEAPGVFEAVLAALRDEPVNVVVTVGPGVDPARLGRQPSHVLVESYIAQQLLLPHVSAVVSHGGAGTTLAAVAAGLPAVLLPHGAEQFVNAAMVSEAGAGELLTPEEITVRAVRAAVRRVLTDPGYRDSARRIAAEMSEMPAPAEVVESLERVPLLS